MKYHPAELAQTLFEEAGDALFLFDPDSEQILDVNPMAQRLCGQTRQEMLKLPVTYLFRSEAPHGLQRLRHAFQKTGMFHSQEGFLLRYQLGGVWIPVNLTISRLHAEPETLGLVTARDVREHRETLKRLQQSEEQLATILSTAVDGMMMLDCTGRVTFANEAAERILGVAHGQLSGRHRRDAPWKASRPDGRPISEQDFTFLRVLRTGQPSCNVERVIARADGTQVIITLNAAPVRGPTEGIVGVVVSFTDVTAQRRAEQAVRESEKKYRDLVETSHDLIWAVDAQGRFSFVNQTGARHLLGREPEDVIGRHFSEVVDPTCAPRDQEAFSRVRDEGSLFQYEGIILRPDGQRVCTSSNCVVVCDEQGAFRGTTGTSRDITERKLAEEALRASEQRYRLLVERNLAGFVRSTPDGRVLDCNDALARVLGYDSKEEIKRHNSTDFYFHPDDRRQLLDLLQEQASVQNYEARLRRRDGTPVWVLENISQLTDEQGQVVYEATVIDITERKHAEEALLERAMLFSLRAEVSVALSQGGALQPVLQRCAEVLYRQLDVAFFRIWTLDEAGQLLELQASAGLYTHRDGPHSRVPVGSLKIGRIVASRLPHVTNTVLQDPHISDPEWAEREGMVAFAGYPLLVEGRPVGVMATFARKPLAASAIAGLDSIGDLIAQWIDRKRAEEALRASEAKYRALIENLEQCILLKDRELRFVAANGPFCRSLARPENAIVGRTDFDFYPRDLAEKYRGDDLRVLREGHRFEGEEENLADGKRRVVRVIKTPVRNGHGRIEGVLAIFWDVTEQRALEAQLRQAQKMEGIGQLAGGIAHDFNNLLQAVLGNASLALASMPATDPNRSLIAAAEKATLRASDLVRKLLGFSRKTVLQLEPLHLNHVVEETLEFFCRSVDPQIQVEFRPAPNLGCVEADPSQVGQVILNLCINSRDAMPDGGRLKLTTGNVQVTEEEARRHVGARAGPHVRLCVADTGHGMTPEVLARIYEPFFTTKEAGKGTGLGLAMVFGIVQQHQGWIDCQSEPGRGTTFSIFLPQVMADAPAPPMAPPRSPNRGHETILFVEDEPVVRTVGRTILERFGYTVLLAEDGQHALEVYERAGREIDLVILDLTMPRLSGREALRELLRLDPQVRVIFSSGYSAEPPVPTDERNVFGFIGKPYRPDELAGMVRHVLDRLPARAAAAVTA